MSCRLGLRPGFGRPGAEGPAELSGADRTGGVDDWSLSSGLNLVIAVNVGGVVALVFGLFSSEKARAESPTGR